MTTARLIEIFSSIQGEGPHVGRSMTFVRFEGCDLKCRWCDTPASFSKHPQYRVEKNSFSDLWELHNNPVLNGDLNQWISHFSDPIVSLTGGEPLQQADFLEEWLPEISKTSRFLLETSGVLPEALARVLPWIHIVSMDFKLPSSAKTGVFWNEHEAFLKLAVRSPEYYVKIVLTESTSLEDFVRALDLIRSVEINTPLILQPVSQTRSCRENLSSGSLKNFFELARSSLPDVRVIPQVHKFLGVV